MTRAQKVKRWKRARRRYRANPSTTNLRAFMQAKSMFGWYDSRMFYGLSRDVAHNIKRAAVRANRAWLVPTSTTGGVHSPTSLHPSGRALDVGLPGPLIGTAAGRSRLVAFQRDEFNAWSRGHRPGLVELIGPDNNLIVLRGVHSPLPEGTPLENQHDNHVHLGYAQ